MADWFHVCIPAAGKRTNGSTPQDANPYLKWAFCGGGQLYGHAQASIRGAACGPIVRAVEEGQGSREGGDVSGAAPGRGQLVDFAQGAVYREPAALHRIALIRGNGRLLLLALTTRSMRSRVSCVPTAENTRLPRRRLVPKKSSGRAALSSMTGSGSCLESWLPLAFFVPFGIYCLHDIHRPLTGI
jgi:hypothetical protein